MNKKEWCKKIDEAYNMIKKPLIMAFTEFYGEEYLDKISDVINNLTIMKMCPNYSKEEFEIEKKKVLYELNSLVKQIASCMNLQFDSVNSMKIITRLEDCTNDEVEKLINTYPKLNRKLVSDVIRLKLRYEFLEMALSEKVNDTDSSILLGVNDDKLNDSEKIKLNRQVQKGSKSSVLEAYHFMYMPAIGVKQSVINMHSIIHEINHLLRKKIELNLPINNNLELRDKWYGVNNYNSNKDLFYEIINDLMAGDIFNIFNKYYQDSGNHIIENNVCDSYYLLINHVIKGIVEEIYNDNKDIIKSILIELGGDEFVSHIKLENYDHVNKLLVDTYQNIGKMFKDGLPKLEVYEKGINTHDLDVLRMVSGVISKRLSEYQLVQKSK